MRNGGIHVPTKKKKKKKKKKKIYKISKKLTSLFCAVDQLSFHQSSMGSSKYIYTWLYNNKNHFSSTRTHKKTKMQC